MHESLRPEITFNLTEVASKILECEMGEIISVPLPTGFNFQHNHYNRIDSLFKQKLVNTDRDPSELYFIPEFVIGSGPNALTIYKDTSYNINIFKMMNARLEGVLAKYPAVYPILMNRLTKVMPSKEKNQFGVLAVDTQISLEVVTGFENLPLTVLKALRQLTNDPLTVIQ